MVSINDNSALLLFRVGPVLCCAPCQPINAIIQPLPLTRTPGSRPGHPGIFKYAQAIVTELELRYQFGLDESQWSDPGRTIVTSLDKQHVGFHVDEILDVTHMPTSGWSSLPALLPRGIFTRTLMHKDHIFLYAEFSQLQHIPHSGYLRQYIQHLLESTQSKTGTQTHVQATPKSQTATSTHPPDPGPGHESMAKHAPNKMAAKRDVAIAQVTPKPQNLNTSNWPTNKPATSSTRYATRPAHVIPREPQDKTPRVHAPAPHTTQSSTPNKATPRQHEPPPTKTTVKKPPGMQTNVLQRSATPRNTAAQAVTKASSRDDATHPIMGIMLVFLFLIILGGGIWYVLLRDKQAPNTNETTQVAALTSQTSGLSSPTDSDLPATTPARSALPQTSPPQTQTVAPSPSATKLATPKPQTQTPIPAKTSHLTAPVINKKSKGPDTSVDQYHAHIQKKAHELTITLDVPADDPSFKTPQIKSSSPVHTSPGNPAKADKAVNEAKASSSESTQTTQPEPSTPANVTKQTVVIIHVVVKGDTLWDIAKRYVQDPYRYPELARLSKIKNPDLIYPGERVRIIKRKRQP